MKFGILFAILILFFAMACVAQPQPKELRGVWLTNVDSDVLFSKAAIDEAMQFLADHHFNTVYPVVWNKAHTLFPSEVMAREFGDPIDPRFVGRDPLQEVIDVAHRHGLRVIPWFEFGFSSSYQMNGGYLLKIKPDWAARDRDGNLLTKNGFEWMNAYHPEVQQFIIDMVMEVVEKYDVDGVQGDDRLPAQPIEGGYSNYTDSLYRAENGGNPPPQDFRDLQWQRWRGDKLNAFAKRLYETVKSRKPDIAISWAPSVYPWSFDEYLQDWPNWLKNGYVDEIIPQIYRYELDQYKQTVDALGMEFLGTNPDQQRKIFAGMLVKVGKYRISGDYLIAAIKYHRAKGFNGEVFFFYEGLRENNDELAKLLLQTVYAEPAK